MSSHGLPLLVSPTRSQGSVATRILTVLRRWVPYANEQYTNWHGRPRCGHFFGGSYWYMGETLATALVLAVASAEDGWDAAEIGLPRELVRTRVTHAVRYACFTHDTGPADCVRTESELTYVSGKKWGGCGDRFFMASQNGRSIAMLACTALLMADELDPETLALVRTVICSYADEWSAREPHNGAYYDTQCEENSWTSAGIAAAAALYPEHPNHERWQAGFRLWARNAVTVPADRARSPHGLIDPTGDHSIQTVTFHPDFTAENHGFVHPAYMCAGINLRAYHAVLAGMTGAPVDPAATMNNKELYQAAIDFWTQADGVITPVQGQDWWYNRQHDALVTHTVLAVVAGHPRAAAHAENAVGAIEALQNSNSRGCLLEEHGEQCVINAQHGQFANQLEHGSAADLAVAYLLHRYSTGAPDPHAEQPPQPATGVRHYPSGGVVVHRGQRHFTSFSYRNHVMAYAAPAEGMWLVTPHYLSYLGSVTDEPAAGGETVIPGVEQVCVITEPDSFAVSAVVPRCAGAVRQRVLFASQPDGTALYAERLVASEPVTVAIATGLIGVRNEHYRAMPARAPGARRLFYSAGDLSFPGFYGREPDRTHELPPREWLNLDDRHGYLLYGSGGVRYLNRHVYPKWRGVEDQLILNYDPARRLGPDTACSTFAVLSMPNQPAEATADAAGRGRLLHGGDDVIAVEDEGRLIFARFSDTPGAVVLRAPATPRWFVYPGTQRISGGSRQWSAVRRSGPCVEHAVLEVRTDQTPETLIVTASDEAVAFTNDGANTVHLTVTRLAEPRAGNERVVLPAGTTRMVMIGR